MKNYPACRVKLLLSVDNFCKLFWPRTTVLSWIQTVWHSDSVPERIFEKSWFENSQQTTTKAWIITQHAKSWTETTEILWEVSLTLEFWTVYYKDSKSPYNDHLEISDMTFTSQYSACPTCILAAILASGCFLNRYYRKKASLWNFGQYIIMTQNPPMVTWKSLTWRLPLNTPHVPCVSSSDSKL